MKLQPRFLSVLIPLVLVPLILAALVAHRLVTAMAETNAAHQVELLAHSARQNLDLATREAGDYANWIIASGRLDANLGQPAQLQATLNQLRSQFQERLLQVAVVTPNGQLLAQSTSLAHPGALSFQTEDSMPHLQRIAGLNAPLLQLAHPFSDSAGQPLRLIIGVAADGLQALIDNTRRSSHILLFLVDAQFHWLSTPPAFAAGQTAQAWLSNPDYFISQIALSPGLKLIGARPKQDLLQYLEHTDINLSYIAIAAGIIAVVILHLLISRYVTIPLQKLQKMTEAITNGDFSNIATLSRNDEFGTLSRSFNAMRRHLQQSSRQIEELAYYDTLTGLPNKVTSIDAMQQLIERSGNAGYQVAVLLLDLDNFKNINDALGHQVGDILLMQVGARLKDCIRSHDMMQTPARDVSEQRSDLLARMGGDEFTLVLSGIHSPGQAAKVAGRILAKLTEPFQLNEHEVCTGASLGIAMYPKDGETPEDLLKHADVAMYEAKAKGKNNFQFYDPTMHKPVAERLAMETSMRSALDNNEFLLFYQPKVPVQGQERIEFEALMRWRHPEKGLISPALFIPLAEDTGYIRQLGDWALETTCRQIETWNKAGYRNLSISVNLSPVQINFGNPLLTLQRCLQEYAIDPQQLELEITESSLMQNEAHSIEVLCQMKELGVRVALDDFGTGYSSLAYLRRFPIDTLKIDRSFIRDLEQDPESVLVLESIIGLAQNLKLEIVAEGIETEQQLNILRDRGCQFIQGFYFAKPEEADKAIAFFERYLELPQAANAL